MDKFLAYVVQFDPDFPGRIRGATPQQLAELEQLSGIPLPRSYTAFLLKMGVDDGGVNLTVDGTTNIKEMIAYYRSELLTRERELPGQCILTGVGAVSVPDIGLDCRGPGDPPVMFTDGDEYAGLYAETLEKLLFNSAFSKYRLALFPWEAFYAASFASLGRRDVSGTARAVAAECGFEPAWFSDRVTWCGEKLDAAVCITQYEGQGIAIRVAAQDREEVVRVGSAFLRQLGVRLIEWQDRRDEVR